MKKIDYKQVGDYLIPDLRVYDLSQLGRYGQMRKEYLKKAQFSYYCRIMSDRGTALMELVGTDIEANIMRDNLLEKMKKERNVTEELKEANSVRWVQEMNNIHNCIEELIKEEWIYRD